MIHNRFKILSQLGKGGQGTTYLAHDQQTGSKVALKELRLVRAADWKSIELFEREGKALKNLQHPAIPAFINAFHSDNSTRFFLAQEYIDGEPLAAPIERLDLMNEAQAHNFLLEMLDVLEYLHALSPPLIHRDIKPSNIMRRTNGALALIDFGAVAVRVSDDTGGSTIVGTTGYMPPEQLTGQATPATDLYALAATIVHAVTGIHPINLPMVRMKLQFREISGLSDHLNNVLDAMLEPELSKRLKNVQAVRDALIHNAYPLELASSPSVSITKNSPGNDAQNIENLLLNAPSNNLITAASIQDNQLKLEAIMPQIIPTKHIFGFLLFGFILIGIIFNWAFAIIVLIAILTTTKNLLFIKAKKESLIISPAGITLNTWNVIRFTNQNKPPLKVFIPIADINTIYIQTYSPDEMREAKINKIHLELPGKAGLNIITGQETHVFAGKLVQTSVFPNPSDTAELHWAQNLVQTYLQEYHQLRITLNHAETSVENSPTTELVQPFGNT